MIPNTPYMIYMTHMTYMVKMTHQFNGEHTDCSGHGVWKTDSLHRDKAEFLSNMTSKNSQWIHQRPNVKEKYNVYRKCKKISRV